MWRSACFAAFVKLFVHTHADVIVGRLGARVVTQILAHDQLEEPDEAGLDGGRADLAVILRLGPITFGTGASTGAFATAGGGVETFAAGDRLAIINQDPSDATLANLSITFLGKRT
jgi:hypothetical protein